MVPVEPLEPRVVAHGTPLLDSAVGTPHRPACVRRRLDLAPPARRAAVMTRPSAPRDQVLRGAGTVGLLEGVLDVLRRLLEAALGLVLAALGLEILVVGRVADGLLELA